MKKRKKIALSWWWTWGHIFPLVALYNFLSKDNKYDFIWIWEENSLEEKIAKEYIIKFKDISVWKIRRYLDYRNLYEPLKNLTWIFESIYYIYKENIDIVFSKWWYVSLPMIIAAKIMMKKLYIHESDTVVWISNKIAWIFANKIFYSFPNNKIDWVKHIYSWQIINKEILKEIDQVDENENEKLNILVIGGTQWAKNIFEKILNIIDKTPDINYNLILGSKNTDFKEKFKQYSNIKTFDILSQSEIWKILKKTDISITRWWATSLWELYYFWIHSIIIPLKNSAWNHQFKNAQYFKENFWSDLLEENDYLENKLLKKLLKYKELRKNWLNIENIDSALKIIKTEIDNNIKN